MKDLLNKNRLRQLLFVMLPIWVHLANYQLFAQSVVFSGVHTEWRSQDKKPTHHALIYPLIAELIESEIHTLEALSEEENKGIEQQESPKAIGIGRYLKNPIDFDLSRIEIPEQGAIPAFGGRLARINSQTLVWTTMIQSKEASELRVFISEGFFPAGVSVNLFSENGCAFSQSELRGKVGDDGFFTTTIFADHVIMQVIIPVEAIDKGLYFEIPMIIHVVESGLNPEIFRNCYEDVSCEEAAGFPLINNLKSSVAWLLFYVSPYYYICTGTLLNDTREKDFQPFLLTASHCINSQAVAASLEARFDYYTTSCNGPVNENIVLVNGSNLMVTGSETDFSILLLNQLPAGQRVFNGWITTTAEDDEVFHSVHHPGGVSQQYSRFQNKYVPVNLCSGTPLTHFYYTRTQAGRVAGGSSGAAIVNASGQVAGQLKSICLGSGYNPCNFNTYYVTWGKFDVSYSQSNLQFWLAGGGASVVMNISESKISFGEVAVGDSAIQIIEIQNTGMVPFNLNLEIQHTEVTGNDADEFTVDENADLYLSPGQSGFMSLRFAPKSTGTKSASLVIHHNADNIESPVQVSLQGQAIPAAELLIQNLSILSSQSICFAASQTITLAGDDTYFIVETGGAVELLAGLNVLMKPGTHVSPGGLLNARIVVDNQYCPDIPVRMIFEKPRTNSKEGFYKSTEVPGFLVISPNPSTGRFTIETQENNDDSVLVLEVFDLTGKSILRSNFSATENRVLDISHCKPGLYIVRFTQSMKSISGKIVLIR